MSDRWIIIPNWERYQHYKDRDPPWIKNYRSQLHNDDWLGLTMAQRGLLDALRLLYAASDKKLRASPAYISKQLGMPTEWELRKRTEEVARAWRERGESVASFSTDDVEETVRGRDLKALEQRGFIVISASKPLASASTDASPEAETETERERTAVVKGSSGEPSDDRLGTDREYALVRLLSEVKGSDEEKGRLRKWIEEAEISPGLSAPASAIHLAREELVRMRGETKIKNEPAYARRIIDRYVKGES